MSSSDAADVPRTLPRGPHRLGRETVRASQRTRMLDAITEAVASQGYAATTVADVIERAGVSRRTFYEHFADKEDCFLAAFDAGAAEITKEVVDATNAHTHRDDRIRAGYEALCTTLAARPAFARTFAVLAPEAGPAAQARRAAIREGTVALLRELVATGRKRHPDLPPELSEHAARAIVGAVDALIVHQIETRAPERLPELVPTILGVAHALLLADVPAPGG